MVSFYLTLMAVLVSGFGARDQVTMGQLTLKQGARPAALVIGIVLAIVTAAAAAYAASLVAPMLQPRARTILAAMALAFAGGESLLIAPGRKPSEPTNSLAALAVVLLAHQLTDAARFLVFAVGVGTNAPLPAGIGGAIGGAALIAAGWFAPALVVNPRARLLRRAFGLILLLIAIYVALKGFQRI
ncbi:MAG: hypothetical protein KDE55_19230 [Novosphingobium sp.]|nr:hypothetical protein [Novosphingobium sp.]